MTTIYIGLIGYSILFLYDLFSLYQVKHRSLLAYGGYIIHVYAITIAARNETTLSIPNWLNWVGWLLVFIGGSWLIYCLFLFPPILKNYRRNSKLELTTEGPYALSRHPGVYGYITFIIGLILVSGSPLLLKSGLIWIMANLIYVFIQDRWIFPSLFTRYKEYRKQTPFIIPNIEGIKCFLEYYHSTEK